MGGKGGGGSVSTELPPEIRPLASRISNIAKGALDRSEQFSNQARELQPFRLLPDQSSPTVQGQNLTLQRGGQGTERFLGDDLIDASQQQLTDTAQGDFLFGGPAQRAALAELRDIIPGITSQFAGAGRLNSGLAQEAIGEAAADALAGQFGQERLNQIRAAAAAPGLSQIDFSDIAAISGVGGARDSREAARLQEEAGRFAFNQDEPRQRVAELLQATALSPGLGQFGGVQTTSGGGPGAFQSALGGASLGLGLNSALGIGAGAGAIEAGTGLAAAGALGPFAPFALPAAGILGGLLFS